MATISRNLRRRSISSFIIALASIAIAPFSLAAKYPGKVATTFAAPPRVDQAHFTHTAATYPVENCNDSGTGSLRDAASHAVAGDTIDLSQLTCGTIVLTSGEISVNDVVIQGPGQDLLTISGNNQNRIFSHTGTGTLTIKDLKLAFGFMMEVVPNEVTGLGNGGGCIHSSASVSIQYSTVTQCEYFGVSPTEIPDDAGGGAILAHAISLDHSVVSDSRVSFKNADPNSFFFGAGGGIAANSVDVKDSVISGNLAAHAGGGIAAMPINDKDVKSSATVTNSTIANNAIYNPYSAGAGGIFVGTGQLTIAGSTISGNFSTHATGGIYLAEDHDEFPPSSYSKFSMHNSTVSGNRSGTNVGGATINASDGFSVSNDTIVRNSSGRSDGGTVGLVLADVNGGSFLGNSIIALNTSSNGMGVDAFYISGWSGLSGSNNLILTGSLTDGPNAVHGCPRLLPLGNYGGPTQTHALAPNSPAIDNGGATDDLYDQRGLPRVVGTASDVGAYERQKTPADLAMRIDGFKTIDAASRNCIPATH